MCKLPNSAINNFNFINNLKVVTFNIKTLILLLRLPYSFDERWPQFLYIPHDVVQF